MKIYAAGKFVETAQKLEVKAPYDDTLIAHTYLADEALLMQCIHEANACAETMKKLPVYEKYAILKQIEQKLWQRQEEIAQTIAQEAAKPLRYAKAEVARAIQTFNIAAEETRRIPGEWMSIDWMPEARNKEAIVKYFPVGLVAGITPFNFPLNLVAHKVAPAIAVGCPIIVKPASSTPLTCLLLAQIIDETPLPKGAFSVLPMNRSVGNLLVKDERVKMVSFTGSPDVGWKMKNDAGKKKVVLELGGNAAAIVTPTANFDLAVKRCLTGAFAYAGQICIHTQRIFVHQSIFEKFITNLAAASKLLKFGNPIDEETDITVMIDEANAIRVEEWIQEAVNDGAKLISGGKRNNKYIEPTILTKTNANHKVYAEEVFGPTVVVEPYNTFTEAVEMVNNSRFGLQAGVFTNQLDEMNMAFADLEVGGVIINDVPTFRADQMPYGGIKDSGFGREGVKYAMFDMLEAKCLVKNIDVV